ncbi:MAG: response regulator [Verrucomicrobia bacterium]|jgi:DNA-binding response OmpR family regulator|nr:response regulator [Verrucomicrobiota bacterium]
MDPEPTILVVDDQQINIRLLERKLARNGMIVKSATNGEEALVLARETLPDVVLLDIMMPGMDGIEVCRKLKEKETTRDIPVVFITARTSKEGKLEGLDVGAADYLVKPIDLDETIARVRTQIRIVQQHEENIRLTRELEKSRRQNAIMHLTEGIAHNMNNLLGVMVGYVSLMQRQLDNPGKVGQNCERLEAAIKRMTRIVHQLTVIGHFKSLQKKEVPLDRLLQGAVARFHRVSGTDNPVRLEVSLPEGFTIFTNQELFESAFERLLQNAFESYNPEEDAAEDADRPISMNVFLENAEEELVVEVVDRGSGIDDTIRDSIFEPFVSSSSVIGRGMGLTIVRHGVNCLGGTVRLRDGEDGGTVAEVRLPMDAEEASEEESKKNDAA